MLLFIFRKPFKITLSPLSYRIFTVVLPGSGTNRLFETEKSMLDSSSYVSTNDCFWKWFFNDRWIYFYVTCKIFRYIFQIFRSFWFKKSPRCHENVQFHKNELFFKKLQEIWAILNKIGILNDVKSVFTFKLSLDEFNYQSDYLFHNIGKFSTRTSKSLLHFPS